MFVPFEKPKTLMSSLFSDLICFFHNVSLSQINSKVFEINFFTLIQPIIYGLFAYACICVAHLLQKEQSSLDDDATEDIPAKENLPFHTLNKSKISVYSNTNQSVKKLKIKQYSQWSELTDNMNKISLTVEENKIFFNNIPQTIHKNIIMHNILTNKESKSLFAEENWY